MTNPDTPKTQMNPTNPPATPDPPETTRKVALITGGAKRVGATIAMELASQGMDIAFTYLTSENDAHQLTQQIQQLGRRVLAIKIDLANPTADQQIHHTFTHHFSRLDALINNASTFEPSPLGSITCETFDRNMAINARAPMLLIQRFAEMLSENYDTNDPASLGRIVNFIDIHVLGEPLKGYLAYNASKAALMEITATLALELAPKITVNAIAPGVIAWAESGGENRGAYDEQMKTAYMTRVPLARPGTPQDAAAAVKFLVLGAHYTTGQTLKLDGGRSLT